MTIEEVWNCEKRKTFIEKHYDSIIKDEDYADQMHEQLTQYLIKCNHLPVGAKQLNNISVMMLIVDELENITDDCCNIGRLLKKSMIADGGDDE